MRRNLFMFMHDDLLKNTQKQASDLIQNNFIKEAEEILLQALKIWDDRGLKQLLSICKIAKKEYKEAEELLRKTLENHPSPSDYNNLSIVLKSTERMEEALEYAKMAVSLGSKNHRYFANLANIYFQLKQYENAFKYLTEAVTLCPESTEYKMNFAAFHTQLGQKSEALIKIKEAIKIQEKSEYYVEIFYILSSQKKYKECWQFYEHRYESIPQVKMLIDKYKLPVIFHKKNYYEEEIAVVFEQGLGDNIMFSRFLPLFFAKAPNAYLVNEDEGAASFFEKLGVPCEKTVKNTTTHLLGIMSLPYHLGIEKIPKPITAWQHNPQKTEKLKVGIVWAGSAYHPTDDKRSTYFEDFLPFVNDPNFQVISLMKDKRKRKKVGFEQVIDYARGFENYNILDYGTQITNVESTINLLNRIDVLVCVDTAIAHIAGVLGVPVYLLLDSNCDWRWGNTEYSSDWYESITIFRKKSDESYRKLIEKVHKKIRDGICVP